MVAPLMVTKEFMSATFAVVPGNLGLKTAEI